MASSSTASLRQLGASSSGYDDAVAQLREPFVILDTAERLIVWNPAYAKLHHDRHGACILRPGMSVDELSTWRLQNGFFHALGGYGPDIEPPIHYRDQGKGALIYRLRDGRWMLVERYQFADGRHVGLWIDITALKQTEALLRETAERLARHEAELSQTQAALELTNESLERRVRERTEELLAAQDELLKKQRLSVVGQLTATVAHELRNPMSAIKNTVFTLKELATDKQWDIARLLERIERSVGRCDKIVEELLDYSRSRDLQSEVRSFDPWLHEIMAEFTARPNIDIVLELRAGDAKVALDSDRLRCVVINLVENAVQALADAKDTDTPARITLRTRTLERAVEFEIEDNGPGIPPENLAKVFEPLFSTKRQGTGLGLPTVKQIVLQHGGEIELKSVVDQYTRAIIRLPLA
jgi:signal transduction histidine kinase